MNWKSLLSALGSNESKSTRPESTNSVPPPPPPPVPEVPPPPPPSPRKESPRTRRVEPDPERRALRERMHQEILRRRIHQDILSRNRDSSRDSSSSSLETADTTEEWSSDDESPLPPPPPPPAEELRRPSSLPPPPPPFVPDEDGMPRSNSFPKLPANLPEPPRSLSDSEHSRIYSLDGGNENELSPPSSVSSSSEELYRRPLPPTPSAEPRMAEAEPEPSQTNEERNLPPPEALTANRARSYATVHDARVEFFFKMCRGLEDDQLFRMAEASWREDPLDTLKIAFHARDCRGGKGERKIFFSFMRWLSRKSLSSLLVNLNLVPEYGRWLDFVELAEIPELRQTIWMLLARQLRKDREEMMLGHPVSLVAKWIPSEGGKWDRRLGATKDISRILRVNLRDLRREYLSPLRAYLQIVEKFMCSRQWEEIDYNRVPSVAMHRLKKAFARNDESRFNEWKQALEQGRPDAKVNAKVLFPHDLVRSYLGYAPQPDQVTEAQWRVLRDETAKLGNFGRSLVISDVSGSMTCNNSTPLCVSIALGIMISSLTWGPFNNKIITFSERPTFHDVRGSNLFEQIQNVRHMNWGMNTNFRAVFDLILNKAREHQVPPENMPDRLYVLSDMQFDRADNSNFRTNYEMIRQEYARYGYDTPEIVFWNLNGATLDFPVGDARSQGVAMVSGFTTSILKALLNGRELSPVTVLADALDCKRYNPIRYFDNMD